MIPADLQAGYRFKGTCELPPGTTGGQIVLDIEAVPQVLQ